MTSHDTKQVTPMLKTPRLRFGPSPTGFMPIGGFRTILWNWLYTKQQSGSFILRIEDTDVERTVPDSIEFLLNGMNWLGLTYDEGPIIGGPFTPYVQTERRDIYVKYAQQLIASGHAYTCYCTEEELAQSHKEHSAKGLPPRYDRTCRYLTAEQRATREGEGKLFVVRFAVPLEGDITVHDEIHGESTFRNENLDDMILLKSNGLPTYHLAALVDDHLMQITHVLRGEEWYSSFPIHMHIYKAFDWDVPKFYHLPNMLKKDRTKLSKRKGRDGGAPTWFQCKEEGILPEALLNFLVLQGWSYDDKTEIFSIDEMIKVFDLNRIGVSGAIYDEDKFYWMNGVYIRKLTPDDLLEKTLPYMERPMSEGGLPDEVQRPLDRAYTKRALLLEQERLKTLGASTEALAFFYIAPQVYDSSLLVDTGVDTATAASILEQVDTMLSAIEMKKWQADTLEQSLRALGAQLGLKPKQFLGTLRVALSNRPATPPLFAVMEVLGRKQTLARMHHMLYTLPEGENNYV
jgi:glutamyl-tRNA synthetase